MKNITLFVSALSLLSVSQVGAEKPMERATPADIESLALKAITSGRLEDLQAAAKAVRDLKPEQRSRLPLRVRPDGVEFRLSGEFPADELQIENLEYLISNRNKAHESLLVVGAAELKRLKKVGEALEALKKTGAQVVLDYRLSWVESGGRSRVEHLHDILGLVKDTELKDFFDQLHFNEDGLGAQNVQADPAMLPTRRISAELLLTIRRQ